MNILLVNTNQISIRFVEDLLAKNNIHGEIAMVRAGKFALDLVQGMHVDLLVCEIESETKEKTKHFLSESRKMTPDAYYFILMDGESLEYMEEDFLNSLDDFITIPFEDRALKLRLNRGILACIEKKKKAGITAGRPSTKLAETIPVDAVPVETEDARRSKPEVQLKTIDSQATPSSAHQEPVPIREKDTDAEKPSTSGRRVPREEFQYEPSYEELLQQRNRVLRKEKEAAWLQTMSSQISSYAQDEEIEKPIRIREDRKPDPITPSNAETTHDILSAPEASTVPDPGIIHGLESIVPQTVKPIQNEALQSKTMEAAETPKAKSAVKSFFQSLSKLKLKSEPLNPQPLLSPADASAEDTGSIRPISSEIVPESKEAPVDEPETENTPVPDTRTPLETYPIPSTEPSFEPLAQPPTDSPVDLPDNLSSEPTYEPSMEPSGEQIAETQAEPQAEPSIEIFIDIPTDTPIGQQADHPVDGSIDEAVEHSLDSSQDSLIQDEMESENDSAIEHITPSDIEHIFPSDDGIPEESFLDSPVTDEEYVQEIPPPISGTDEPDLTETAPEVTPSFAVDDSPEEPLSDTPSEEPSSPHVPFVDELPDKTRHPEESQGPKESTEDPADETQRIDEMQQVEEIVENPEIAQESPGSIPVTGVPEDVAPDVSRDPSDVPVEPVPERDVPASGIEIPIQTDEDAIGQTAEEAGESINSPSPRQVPHLQDDIWLDPTEPFILEPEESVDDTEAPFTDIIEEEEIFGAEEDLDISLVAEEDPLLEEVLVMPFEEDSLKRPETLPEPLQDSDEGLTSREEENRILDDLPFEGNDLTSSAVLMDEPSLPDEEMTFQEKPDDPPASVFQTDGSDDLLQDKEKPVEDIPEPPSKVPAPEEVPVPPKKDSLDLRQYLREPEKDETKGLKGKFRNPFGKKPPS